MWEIPTIFKRIRSRKHVMPGTNLKFVRAFCEAFGRGDLPNTTSVFADELVRVEPRFPGHDRRMFPRHTNVIDNVLTQVISSLSNLTVTTEQIAEAGDQVVVDGLYRGPHAKTERQPESRFVHMWTINAREAVPYGDVTWYSADPTYSLEAANW